VRSAFLRLQLLSRWLTRRRKPIDQALKSWQQALKIYREIKNRRGESYALGALGIAYYSLGNYPKAIEYQEQGLVLAREVKDRRGESVILRSLSSMYRAVGNSTKANDYEAKGLVIEYETTGKIQW
jgi:tetratricopeptide (TPR) repeat protein